ncbi:radical SAM protein [Aggregatilinea lenta]|uniref:radical SAM protein n=1 Tax=Aggregatilinea lenta TaxID=913108 RepID=UPI000E5B8241|nr:radical SAM protein [Aggregatilinea lenta]
MPINATHPTTAETITASLAGASLVLSPCFGESYSFDRAGRLLGLFVGGRSYQRALDHRLLERGAAGARRRELPPDEAAALLDRTFARLHDLAGVVARLDLPHDDRLMLWEGLAKILAFGPDRLATDGGTFRALYRPVSILPPDQYLALVLQATEGCSWNRCTFCGLYRDRTFLIHSPASFRAHCEGVRDFFGDGLSLRRGIFLADANALIIPQARLRALLQTAQAVFGTPDTPRPVFSFVSAFDVGRKSAAEWTELRALGLERAYIGLETGSDDLLRFLNKPGTAQDAVEAVRALRAGGVSAGVILMAGIGGDRFAAAHVAQSVEAVRAMGLGPGDLVYLSRYVPAPGTEYPTLAAEAGIRALADAEVAAQLSALQTALRAALPGVTVAPYQVDGFAL